jgi:predicted nucleotidyltransferase
MRLTDSERKIIKESAKNIFGTRAKVFLFGSRVDDSLKGGDIDLYIETEKQTQLQDKISFITNLKWKLGDQKIDVLVNSPNSKQKDIYRIARETGIEI